MNRMTKLELKHNLLKRVICIEDEAVLMKLRKCIDDHIAKQKAWDDGILEAIKQVESGKTFPANEVFERIRNKFWK